MAMDSVQFRALQGFADSLDADWLPDTYYTVERGSLLPMSNIEGELSHAMRPFVGVAITRVTELQMQQSVDNVLRNRQARGEILIWSNLEGSPQIIDGIGVCNEGHGTFRLRPMLDRTQIMNDLLDEMDRQDRPASTKGTGGQNG